jgi:CRISPR system Cascade subunit CasE
VHLSRLILNPQNRRVQREISDVYQLHRTIMRAFPDHLTDTTERVLFRLERELCEGGLVLLVQSWTRPDWSWLAEPTASNMVLEGGRENPAVKAFDLCLDKGQVLAFRLRANPTVKRGGKRLGLYRESEQQEWLERKALQGGFRILSARMGADEVMHSSLQRLDKTHPLRFLAVDFNGLLQVTDPSRLQEVISLGIGSGKGLGFGLLSLAPPRSD